MSLITGLAAIVVVGVLAVAGVAWSQTRRRRDSVEVFAAATNALQHIAHQPLIEPPPPVPPDPAETPSVHVLHDIGRLRLDRTRTPETGRRGPARRRLDPEALARRPLIASLPTRAADPPRQVG
jgi:hypothetical protein